MARMGDFVGGLNLGVLATPNLTARQRQFVLHNQRDSLATVESFLRGEAWTAGEQVFNTKLRRRQLQATLSQVKQDIRAWKTGHRWPDEFSWIVPGDIAGDTVIGTGDGRLESLVLKVADYGATPPRFLDRDVSDRIRARLKAIRRLRLATYKELHVWLPYLSIEGVRFIAALRQGDISQLMVAFALGVDRLGMSAGLRPWSPGLAKRVGALPVNWLYQFDPCRRLDELLARLRGIGCTNIGHLAVLHPEAMPQLTRRNVDAWVALKVLLETGIPERQVWNATRLVGLARGLT